MIKFLKQYGYPCDLSIETIEHKEYADNGEIYKFEYELIFKKDNQEIDRIFTKDRRKYCNIYVRGFFTAMGYKFPPDKSRYEIEKEGRELEASIKCNYIECAAGMGVAGNYSCFLNGDYTNSDCPKFKSEEEFLKERGEIC